MGNMADIELKEGAHYTANGRGSSESPAERLEYVTPGYGRERGELAKHDVEDEQNPYVHQSVSLTTECTTKPTFAELTMDSR